MLKRQTPERLKVIFLDLSRSVGENASTFRKRGVIIPKPL
jgi:hypothetical protein